MRQSATKAAANRPKRASAKKVKRTSPAKAKQPPKKVKRSSPKGITRPSSKNAKRSPVAAMQAEISALRIELQEAQARENAIGQVMEAINSSPADLAPVFDAILENAMRLCEADFGALCLFNGESFRVTATKGFPIALNDFLQGELPVHPESVPDRVRRGERVIHIPDLTAAERTARTPVFNAMIDLGGARSTVWVDLRKDGRALGFFAIYRQEVSPFSDKQIVLLKSFAAQAVIAMENARLLTETREALEQQTATAEVLQVINSSPGDLAPVFDAIVEKAMRLCETTFGHMMTWDGERFHRIAFRGMPDDLIEEMRQPMKPVPGSFLDQVVQGKDLVCHADLHEAEAGSVGPGAASLMRFGARARAMVALRKDERLLGTIAVYRTEVRPFTDKQIALLQNFAAQAVIAMENARLLGDLRQRTEDLQESLEYQTATSDVLKVISQSRFDLSPVLQTVLDTAMRLCGNTQGQIWRLEDGVYRMAVSFGLEPAYRDVEEKLVIHPGSDNLVGRTATARKPIHIVDALADPEYGPKDDARLGHLRTMLGVPLLRESTPIGVICTARRVVEPFTERQIELVSTFADQAVIAIENTRLITDTQAAREAAETALRELQTAQASLVHAQKMAALGQLTAGIAHEIKNPLNFVNNFAGLSVELLDELKEAAAPGIATLDEDTRAEIDDTVKLLTGNLEKIAEHGQRADGIVKSMLDHSRGGSGERREVNLNALVEEALNLAYHGARAQDQSFNILMEREFDAALAPIEVVPQDVTRVFLNLIGNGFYAAAKRSREATDGYRPVLKVVTRDQGEAVEVRIRDNGTGISPEIRDKLFQPFVTTKPTGEGTGLGLSISYEIVTQQHGGSIEVNSEPGSYTEFTLRLPRRGNGMGAGNRA